MINLKEKHNIDTTLVEDIILGCVTQVMDQAANIAKSAAQAADYGDHLCGVTLNRFCGSGLESINQAAAYIKSGYRDLIIAGGVECMSRVKMGSDGGGMFIDPNLAIPGNIIPQGISADLIAQSEHDEMSQSILVTESKDLINKVQYCINRQLKFLPKKKIASISLSKFGLAILVRNSSEVSQTIDMIAPEHLQIYTKKPNKYLKSIDNAGSIFLGSYTPEAIGDYIAGPNHVLPTSGSAKFSSGLSVNDFLKRHSLIKITKTGIERLGPSVINLAKHENLDGHANSVKLRLKKEN